MKKTTLDVKTEAHTQMIDITGQVQQVVKDSGVTEGLCIVFTPHTTSAITINENADPDVVRDITTELEKIIPWEDDYHHVEGNSAAHIKSTLVGASEEIIIQDGKLLLGIWQGIYFCEYDGPRHRNVFVKILEG